MRVRERWLALESAFPGEHIEQSQPDCPRSIYVPTEREWPPPDGRDDGPRTPRGWAVMSRTSRGASHQRENPNAHNVTSNARTSSDSQSA